MDNTIKMEAKERLAKEWQKEIGEGIRRLQQLDKEIVGLMRNNSLSYPTRASELFKLTDEYVRVTSKMESDVRAVNAIEIELGRSNGAEMFSKLMLDGVYSLDEDFSWLECDLVTISSLKKLLKEWEAEFDEEAELDDADKHLLEDGKEGTIYLWDSSNAVFEICPLTMENCSKIAQIAEDPNTELITDALLEAFEAQTFFAVVDESASPLVVHGIGKTEDEAWGEKIELKYHPYCACRPCTKAVYDEIAAYGYGRLESLVLVTDANGAYYDIEH